LLRKIFIIILICLFVFQLNYGMIIPSGNSNSDLYINSNRQYGGAKVPNWILLSGALVCAYIGNNVAQDGNEVLGVVIILIGGMLIWANH